MERFASIKEISRLLAQRSISSFELCDYLLGAIDRENPVIGAFSDVVGRSARVEARASDARRARQQTLGPLDGVPIAIKDLIDTQPARCSAGLVHLVDYRPTADAAVVQKLRNAGAVILGVTETDPGAFSTDTLKTTNPLAPSRIVGGSSGGSAAAVATGLAFAAIGTDTGGSIRIPAACCSIYGFKPSWGRVDTAGVRPLAQSLDHVGPLARSIADIRLIQQIIDPSIDPASPLPGTMSIGICPAYFADAAPNMRDAMDEVTSLLGSAGTTVTSVALPHPDHVLSFHMVNLPKEAADYHAANFPLEWKAYPPIARDTVGTGLAVDDAAHRVAESQRGAACAAVDLALKDVDAIIVPTMPMDAPERDAPQVELGGRWLTRLQATVRYTALFNQTGHPVITIPAWLLADGRALSIQLVGRRGDDSRLLAVADHVAEILSLAIDYSALKANAGLAGIMRPGVSTQGDIIDSHP